MTTASPELSHDVSVSLIIANLKNTLCNSGVTDPFSHLNSFDAASNGIGALSDEFLPGS